jgi:hypothetical protein
LVNVAGPVSVIIWPDGILPPEGTVSVQVAVVADACTQDFVVPAGTCAWATPPNCVAPNAADTAITRASSPSLTDDFNVSSCWWYLMCKVPLVTVAFNPTRSTDLPRWAEGFRSIGNPPFRLWLGPSSNQDHLPRV